MLETLEAAQARGAERRYANSPAMARRATPSTRCAPTSRGRSRLHAPGARRARGWRPATSIISTPMARRPTAMTSMNLQAMRAWCSASGRSPVSSTKPVHGHALGASGGLELVIADLRRCATRSRRRPSTFIEPDPKCPVDAIPNAARPHADARRHVQFLRFWRHQRGADRAGALAAIRSRAGRNAARASSTSEEERQSARRRL